jgi:surfeit locus 1 family protein
MYVKFLFPIFLGLAGVIILVLLGIWQVHRLDWKNDLLYNIEKKIMAEPVQLVANLSEVNDQYLSVIVEGEIQPGEIHVLTSLKNVGPGFLIVVPLKLMDGRIIMVDMGFIPEIEKKLDRSRGRVNLVGNLLWPNETDGFTPLPDVNKNIWFARDLEKMSKHLKTDKVLVVMTQSEPAGTPTPQRIGIHIANDHLGYAITWFSLAAVWFGMTILLLYRIRKQQV